MLTIGKKVYQAFNRKRSNPGSAREPSKDELIERGFAPKNGKIDVLFIFPPSSVAERYGRKNMGNVGGDLIPLGIASLAAYLREKDFGVGVIDCPALRIDADEVFEIIKKKDPAIVEGARSLERIG